MTHWVRLNQQVTAHKKPTGSIAHGTDLQLQQKDWGTLLQQSCFTSPDFCEMNVRLLSSSSLKDEGFCILICPKDTQLIVSSMQLFHRDLLPLSIPLDIVRATPIFPIVASWTFIRQFPSSSFFIKSFSGNLMSNLTFLLLHLPCTASEIRMCAVSGKVSLIQASSWVHQSTRLATALSPSQSLQSVVELKELLKTEWWRLVSLSIPWRQFTFPCEVYIRNPF